MENAAISITMLATLVLVIAMVALLILLVSLIFFLNKHNQEHGLIGGNWMKKVYRKSQSFAEEIDDEKEKKSVYNRLKMIRFFFRVFLFSLGGVAIAIVL